MSLASPDLLPLILNAGIDSTECDSDHRLIYVDFGASAQFPGSNPADKTRSRPRIVLDLEERLRQQSGIASAVPKRRDSAGQSHQASANKPKTKPSKERGPRRMGLPHVSSRKVPPTVCPVLDLTGDSSDEAGRPLIIPAKRKSRSTKASSESSSTPLKKKGRKI